MMIDHYNFKLEWEAYERESNEKIIAEFGLPDQESYDEDCFDDSIHEDSCE